MAGLQYKKGLVPVQNGNAGAWTGGFEVFQTSVGSGAIFAGDPVFRTANGFVIAPTSTNFPTSTTELAGVAIGAFWIDSTSKQPVEKLYKPASTSSAVGKYNGIHFKSGAGGPGIKVITDRDVVYGIKALASVAIAKLGDRLEFRVSAGSTTTGRSGGRCSIAGGVTDILRCVGVLRADEFGITSTTGGTNVNDWAAPETVVLVKLRNFNEAL